MQSSASSAGIASRQGSAAHQHGPARLQVKVAPQRAQAKVRACDSIIGRSLSQAAHEKSPGAGRDFSLLRA